MERQSERNHDEKKGGVKDKLKGGTGTKKERSYIALKSWTKKCGEKNLKKNKVSKKGGSPKKMKGG